MAGKKHSQNSRKPKKQTVSRSTRAELKFPVSRIERALRKGGYAKRVSPSTPVFLSGVLEYLTSNMLELAGKEARANRRRCITPEHVERVVERNEQFRRLFEEDNKFQHGEMSKLEKKR